MLHKYVALSVSAYMLLNKHRDLHIIGNFQTKEILAKSMRKSDSNLRILLATEAYSMGTDSPNVRHVMHIGPPSEIEGKSKRVVNGYRDTC